MTVGSGKHTYRWHEHWARIPDTSSGRENGRTHGIVVTEAGNFLVFHQANPAALVYNREGKLVGSWGDRFLGAHGMTLVKDGGTENLWLTDQDTAEVVKTTLDGKTIHALKQPDHEAYRKGKYSPTWVAVNEIHRGGNGDIWVADGYGMNLVHRFDAYGRYLQTIDGSEGTAGKFNCPHGIWFDYRTGMPELYIADRGNKRFQVYDGNGRFKRLFGSDFLSCPCACSTLGDELLVPELSAKLVILDKHDRPVAVIGENEQTCNVAGWPNHPRELIVPGKFNSPHAAAADATGNLYVVEWIISGRITKLEKVNQ